MTSLQMIGVPSVQICAAAMGYHADVIVMGTHGRTGLEHIFLGSTAERVLTMAPCPVLTAREPNGSEGHTRVPIKFEYVTGFTGISLAEKEHLVKEMQRACGAGGTVKEGRIEIQGDQREVVARILTNAGFRPVFAGG